VSEHQHDSEQAHGERYQEVSLRAVELLAKAQRAADEAVAEAQSYARDLELSAREQYKQILQRAHAAAQGNVQPAPGSSTEAKAAGADAAGLTLDAQKVMYVRTYARVAHAQLKAVLAALNDELDQLAAMAEGEAPATAPVAPAGTAATGMPATGIPVTADRLLRPPREVNTFDPRPSGGSGSADAMPSAADAGWPPIFAATNAISYVFRGAGSDGRET
jgi:hypothetical protein